MCRQDYVAINIEIFIPTPAPIPLRPPWIWMDRVWHQPLSVDVIDRPEDFKTTQPKISPPSDTPVSPNTNCYG